MENNENVIEETLNPGTSVRYEGSLAAYVGLCGKVLGTDDRDGVPGYYVVQLALGAPGRSSMLSRVPRSDLVLADKPRHALVGDCPVCAGLAPVRH